MIRTFTVGSWEVRQGLVFQLMRVATWREKEYAVVASAESRRGEAWFPLSLEGTHFVIEGLTKRGLRWLAENIFPGGPRIPSAIGLEGCGGRGRVRLDRTAAATNAKRRGAGVEFPDAKAQAPQCRRSGLRSRSRTSARCGGHW